MSFNIMFRYMCFTSECPQHLATGPHLKPHDFNPHAYKLFHDISEVNLAAYCSLSVFYWQLFTYSLTASVHST